MAAKSGFLQIRVTPKEKAAVRRLARAAGMDLSAYVLARAIPQARTEFDTIVNNLGRGLDERFELAALNDLLAGLSAAEFQTTVAHANWQSLSPFSANYVAAMIEHAAQRLGMSPPAWTALIAPLDSPWFASALHGLRLHLMKASQVAFKRRNIFIDATLDDRV
jgi:uncharacterized protein (DUF1778 family)